YCLSLFSFRSHVPQDELSSVITGGLDYSKNVTAQQRAYGVAIAAASALIKVHTHVHTHTHTHVCDIQPQYNIGQSGGHGVFVIDVQTDPHAQEARVIVSEQ